VQRDAGRPELDRLAIIEALDIRPGGQPLPRHRGATGRKMISGAARPKVVAVSVRDDGALHRLPRIDVEIAGATVQAAWGRRDEIRCAH
jgi:hypothetical protein